MAKSVRYRSHRTASVLTLVILGAFLGITVFIAQQTTIFRQEAAELVEKIPPTCYDSLQEKINAAAPGATIIPNEGCVYREQVKITKPITIDGQGKVEIRGSDIWTGWKKKNDHWVSKKRIPQEIRSLSQFHVLRDGQPLLEKKRNPGPENFSVDNDYHVVLGKNPRGHTVEVATREYGLFAIGVPPHSPTRIEDVTVKGLRVTHTQTAGFYFYNSARITLENNILSHNGAEAMSFTSADRLVVQNNELFANRRIGISIGYGTSNGSTVDILNNSIHDGGPSLAIFNIKTLNVNGNKLFNNRGEFIIRCQMCSGSITNNEVYNNSVKDSIGLSNLILILDSPSLTVTGNDLHDNSTY